MGNLIRETPYSEITATLEVLDRHGVTREHLQRLRACPDYAQHVLGSLLGTEPALPKPGLHVRRAQEIMGQNIFGLEDWTALGVTFTPWMVSEAIQFPWSDDVLNAPCPFQPGKRIFQTHFAFLGMETREGNPLTLLAWRSLASSRSVSCEAWCADQAFASRATCCFRWYLMPCSEFTVADGRPYGEQVAAIGADYEVPQAVEEVAKDILYARKRGASPAVPAHIFRCRDTTTGKGRVHIECGAEALKIGATGGSGIGGISIAASRKLPA